MKRQVIISIAGVAVLSAAAGAGTTYLLMKGDQPQASLQSTASTETNQTPASVVENQEKAEQERKAELEKQYEQHKAEIAASQSASQEQRAQAYVNAAFVGAELDKPEAKEYAAEALKLLPQDNNFRNKNKAFLDNLNRIANGDYDINGPVN